MTLATTGSSSCSSSDSHSMSPPPRHGERHQSLCGAGHPVSGLHQQHGGDRPQRPRRTLHQVRTIPDWSCRWCLSAGNPLQLHLLLLLLFGLLSSWSSAKFQLEVRMLLLQQRPPCSSSSLHLLLFFFCGFSLSSSADFPACTHFFPAALCVFFPSERVKPIGCETGEVPSLVSEGEAVCALQRHHQPEPHSSSKDRLKTLVSGWKVRPVQRKYL